MNATISGIPCLIKAGDDGLEVLDRKGYQAAWLARKATAEDWKRIEEAWFDRMQEERGYWLTDSKI